MTSADQVWPESRTHEREPMDQPEPTEAPEPIEGTEPIRAPEPIEGTDPLHAPEPIHETEPIHGTGAANGPPAGEGTEPPAGALDQEAAGAGGADGAAGTTDPGQAIPADFGQGRHERDDLAAPAAAGQQPGSAAGVVQPAETLDRDGAMARWRDIQAGFVDDPAKAVSDADALVGEWVEQLIRRVTAEREQLQAQWHGAGDASTEDLRQGLRRYRSLFERLLGG